MGASENMSSICTMRLQMQQRPLLRARLTMQFCAARMCHRSLDRPRRAMKRSSACWRSCSGCTMLMQQSGLHQACLVGMQGRRTSLRMPCRMILLPGF